MASGKAYSDDDFTPDASAVWWSDIDTIGSIDAGLEKIKISWKRASQITGKHTLFGNGISADDAIQGEVGNCWFIAAASAVADADPSLVKKAFLNTSNTLNAAGIYAVDIYTLGVPHTVVVDDFMPRSLNDSDVVANTFGNVGKDGSLWGPILEKAFAKMVGNYLHTSGGVMAHGVRRIVGGPYEKHMHKKTNANALWKELQAHEGKKDIITVCTEGSNHLETDKDGLTLGHAFTVLGIHTLSNGVRLVKIRNPWGKETFKGAWSDTSALWTDEHAKKVGLKKTLNDGIFHMSIEDYAKKFELTDINYNTKGMHQASFVSLDDLKKKVDACQLEWGDKCRRHTLTLKSDVDQTVWLSAHTWDLRTLPKKCQTDLGYHLFWIEGTKEETIWDKGFSSGSYDMPPI